MMPLTGDGASQIVLSGPLLAALLIAAAAGVLSFFSPCCLPLVPGYLSYVAGVSGAETHFGGGAGADRAAVDGVSAGSAESRGRVKTEAATMARPAPPSARGSRTVAGAVLFVAGFTVVFTSYGLLFGAAGAWLIAYQDVLVRVLGVLTVILGLMFTGLLERIPLAGRTFRFGYQPHTGLAGAPLVGILFGLGWTPCIGPTLAAVLTLATSSADAGRGAALSFTYSAGLGIPFVLAALSMQKVMKTFGWARSHARMITRGGGAMLILLGLLQVTGLWMDVIIWLRPLIVGWQMPL
jgi:cytochrome c-type biogenesis protein